MPRRWCAPWCPERPVRYELCCHTHWASLTEYQRAITRASYRKTHGAWATMMQAWSETLDEGTRARAEASRG